MAFDFQQPNYQSLKSLVLSPKRVNVVPFVGSGLSAYGPQDTCLPSWGELVSKLAQKAEDEHRVNAEQVETIASLKASEQYIEAIDALYTFSNPFWVNNAVEELLDIRAEGISPAAISLMTIAWSIVVTTNLDKMLEFAHEKLIEDDLIDVKRLKVWTHKNLGEFAQSLSFEQSESINLAKIHGSVDDYDSFILSTQQYESLLNNNVYSYLLRDLFRRHLLIIGFSLSDPDFDRALDHISKNFMHRNCPPYVIMSDRIFSKSDNDPRLKRLCELQINNNLNVITYTVEKPCQPDDPWSGHRELFECLRDLSDAWLANYKEFRFHGTTPRIERLFAGRKDQLAQIDDAILRAQSSCQIVGVGGEGKSTLAAEWIRTRKESLIEKKIKDVFFFECYTDSPSLFFRKASQTLTGELSDGNAAQQTASIISFIKANKTLFVFDGFEVFQNANGEVRDRQLDQFINDAIGSGAKFLFTTRQYLPGIEQIIKPGAMTPKEIVDMADLIQPSNLHPANLERINELNGHAQSIRLYLQSISEAKTKSEYQGFDGNIPQSVGRKNRAFQTLKKIEAVLSANEVSFLRTLSVFDRPVSLGLVRQLINLDTVDLGVSQFLGENAFTEMVNGLVEQQLVIGLDGVPSYYLHPNVRDYYRDTIPDKRRINRLIYMLLLEKTASDYVETYAEAQHYIRICFHAASAEEWHIFDKYYRKVLMRGHEDYLCDSLGCWSETLDLTRLVFQDKNPGMRPHIRPAYYLSRHARCLKHLGYGEDASVTYLRCLNECAKELYPDTAMYLNNYLTLQIYMGNLAYAKQLASWNFALISWIPTDQGRRNQIEHGGYSIGWLAMLLGDFDAAQELFDISENAWSSVESEREVIFDYYPVYYAELFLVRDRDYSKAKHIVNRYLESSQSYDWTETEARCHIAYSMIQRSEARIFKDKTSSLQLSWCSCENAQKALTKVFAPPVEIELLIEQLCVFYEHPQRETLGYDEARSLHRLQSLISLLQWNLYESDHLALNGCFHLIRGNLDKAEEYFDASHSVAIKMGLILAIKSTLRPLHILRAFLQHDLTVTIKDQMTGLSRTRFGTVTKHDLLTAVAQNFADAAPS